MFVPGVWSIRVCEHCVIAWLDPQPIPEDMGLAYGGPYYTHLREWAPVSLGRNSLVRALRGAVLSARYGYVALRPQIPFANAVGHLMSVFPAVRKRATLGWQREIPPYTPNGRLLEIGCGDGMYLAAMRELGWEVHGIEPDPAAARRAASNAGATIWPGGIETASVPSGAYDAVVALQSIEHVYDPRLFVERAASFLRPGGFLYIATPNFDSLARRRFHEDWLALDVPRHLHLLTPESLRVISETSGLLRLACVRTLSRRAVREREHVYTVRGTGSFHGDFRPSFAQRISIDIFGIVEKVGNLSLQWGEEIELIAYRR